MESAPATQAGRVRASAPTGRFPAGALVAGIFLTSSWAWWAIKQGAYFPTVFNPGIVVLCAGFVLLLTGAPWRGRLTLSRPARLAMLGLVGLAAWTLASALWSPSPDVSISDAQRVLTYLLAFGLGAWLCNMLGSRMELALAPLVVAAAIVGIVTVAQLLSSHDFSLMLDTDGTLQYPLGYRNATAAFFLIAVWPALALAHHRQIPRAGRVAAAATGSMAVAIAAISQSRGSIGGVLAGLAVFILCSRERPRAVAWAAIVAVPLVWMIPLASDIFESAVDTAVTAAALDPMRAAGKGVVAAAAMTALLGLLLTAGEARIPRRFFPSRRSAVGATALFALAALLVFTVKAGSPISWVSDRYDQFTAGEPSFAGSSSRFGFNVGSNRSDVWRVAIDAVESDPLFGEGSGGFQYRYLRDRDAPTQIARDAHSVELEMASELGIPGLALLALALTGATAGTLRSRKLGPNAAVLATGALAAAAYWLVHSSVDWFWAFPAVTAPVFALLGAACAPAMLDPIPRHSQRGLRIVIGGATALLALSVIPAFLSALYLNNASSEFRNDLPAAYDDVDRAKALNPLSDEPLLIGGAIAKASGDRERAITLFEDAIAKRPEEGAGHYFLAQIYAKSDPKRALAELAAASRLNPLSDRIPQLRKRIEQQQRSGPRQAR